MISDNIQMSDDSMQVSGIKYVRNQMITNKCLVLSGDMPSDHTTSVNIKRMITKYMADINSQIRRYRKNGTNTEIDTNTEKHSVFGK